MSILTIVFENLHKAILAEEKQGFTNTGVMGGFHAFLGGVAPRLEQLLPEYDFGLLRQIYQHYPTLSPAKRREVLKSLKREMLDWQVAGAQNTDLSIPKPGINAEPLTSVSVQAKPPARAQSKPEILSRPTELTSLQYIKGVGPERVKQLHALGISTIEELLLYYPRRYEDRHLRRIAELQDGEIATVDGIVVSGQLHQAKMKVIKLTLEQDGQVAQAVWFNQPYILKQYPAGSHVFITGKVRRQRHLIEIQVTDIVKSDFTHSNHEPRISNYDVAGDIVPVYSESARLSSKVIRGVIQQVLGQTERIFPELLSIPDRGEWLERPKAYREIHFPSSYADLSKARERLVWEEVLFLQLAVARLRNTDQTNNSLILTGDPSVLQTFYRSLPFGLTKAQERVIAEIFRDMARSKGMARLIQGDVGSGKTVVAMAALLQAVTSGYQGAMMAPTEILASQHYHSLKNALMPLGVKVVLLLGSQSRAEREDILAQIREGTAQVIIGTHALIQESVVFHSLGLAVTDEQHRFGVRQRTLLHGKGESPHVLVLTATPIPRTLALTLYGDLQLSVIDELPAGRKPIITSRLSERGRPNLEKFLEEQIKLGRQVYVVCPLVQESEALDLVSAQERADSLAKRFPHRKVALLHGRMKGVEKDAIMNDFLSGKIHILVATTVVEVGVNVPNASVMVIEGAERFGMAQLHQLRGRVGRGSDQSYCIFMSEARSSRRLDILCETQDGFKIAEEDLKLRGPGELLGTRQHGLPELRLTNLAQDGLLIEKAYQFAQRVLNEPEKYEKFFIEAERFYKPEKAGIN